MSPYPWLAPFPEPFQDAVLAALARPGGRPLACFDADGTLWTEDVGEAFLRMLLAGPLEPLVRENPHLYADYEERVRRDIVDGYGWAVQLMAGLSETDVVGWAQELAAAWPNYRREMTALLRGLAEAGAEVWIVSATNVWMVQATASWLGLDENRVIAIRTEVEGGRLTDRLVPPVPCREGKLQAIDRWIGRRPDLACGDGLGDLPMLEGAAHPLAVGQRAQPDGALLEIAARRGWPVHRF